MGLINDVKTEIIKSLESCFTFTPFSLYGPIRGLYQLLPEIFKVACCKGIHILSKLMYNLASKMQF